MVSQVGLSAAFMGIHFADGLSAYEGLRSFARHPDLRWKRVADVPEAVRILTTSPIRYFQWTHGPTGATPSTTPNGAR